MEPKIIVEFRVALIYHCPCGVTIDVTDKIKKSCLSCGTPINMNCKTDWSNMNPTGVLMAAAFGDVVEPVPYEWSLDDILAREG